MIVENEATIDQQAEQLEEMTMKVEDVEVLIDEVSELAKKYLKKFRKGA